MESPRKARRPKTRGAKGTPVVRRSIALPARLIERVIEVSPAEDGGNLNATVRRALEEFVQRSEREAWAGDLASMAADLQIRAEIEAIDGEFRPTESDGLPPA